MRKCKDKRTYKDRPEYYIEQNRKKRIKVKQHCIEYKGGKCENCGYSKCTAALEFHHTDPSKKDFALSDAYRKSIVKINEELDKCKLLCVNCHREAHAELEKLT